METLFGLFLATASCIILRELNPGDDYMAAVQVIYVLAAFMIARFTQGFLYGTFAAVAGVLLTNFIFTYPYWAFNFTLPGYPVTILCALIVSVTTSTMTARIKEQGQLQLEAEREALLPKLEEVKAEMAELNRIRYWTLKVIPDALPRVSDGRVSIEDAMETAVNRKELEQIEYEAVQTALRELGESKPLQSERKQTDKQI